MKKFVEYCRINDIVGILGFCISLAQRPDSEIANQLGLRIFESYEKYYFLHYWRRNPRL